MARYLQASVIDVDSSRLPQRHHTPVPVCRVCPLDGAQIGIQVNHGRGEQTLLLAAPHAWWNANNIPLLLHRVAAGRAVAVLGRVAAQQFTSVVIPKLALREQKDSLTSGYKTQPFAVS